MSNCGDCCNLQNISYPGSWTSDVQSKFVVNKNWTICNYRAYRLCQEYYLNDKRQSFRFVLLCTTS